MKTNKTFLYINTANIKNAVFHLRTFGIRSLIRKASSYLEFTRNYNEWYKKHLIPSSQLAIQKAINFSFSPKISIIVPVYRTPELFLKQMLDSVTAQTYSNWELCIADGSISDTYLYIKDIITNYQKKGYSVKYRKLDDNLGISGNTNAALELASGEYIALLDHDDLLAPNALFEIVSLLNKEPDTDVIYTDEDKTDINLSANYDPYFKPDFNIDLLRSCNYITHFFITKRSLAIEVGGFSDECNGSQDYDFILKTCDCAHSIRHIPKILYHWRIHPASVAGNPEGKNYAYDSAITALNKHLKRNHETGLIEKSGQFGYYHISYSIDTPPLVSIIIKNCNKNINQHIKNITTYPKYEIISSTKDAHGEYYIFLYHVNEILTPNWIEIMLSNCNRNNVGMIGGRIFQNKRKILDFGLVYTPDGHLHSPFNGYHIKDTGYCYRAMIQQNCSILSPYCVMISKNLYRKYAPKQESELFTRIATLSYNLSAHNYWNVLTPDVSVICRHKKRILPILLSCRNKQDPFYNPNFSQKQMYRLSHK